MMLLLAVAWWAVGRRLRRLRLRRQPYRGAHRKPAPELFALGEYYPSTPRPEDPLSWPSFRVPGWATTGKRYRVSAQEVTY